MTYSLNMSRNKFFFNFLIIKDSIKINIHIHKITNYKAQFLRRISYAELKDLLFSNRNLANKIKI